MFHDVSSRNDIFTKSVDPNIPVEIRTKLFLTELNDVFSQTFKKIRIGQKCYSPNVIDEFKVKNAPANISKYSNEDIFN